MDQKLRKFIRQWVGMNPSSSSAMIHLPLRFGGLGILSFSDSYAIASVVNGIRLLNNVDTQVKDIAIKACKREIAVESGGNMGQVIDKLNSGATF